MSTTKLTRPAAFLILAFGCTGLDPGAFDTGHSSPDEHEIAGFSFDAGPPPDAGGRGGASGGSRAASGSSSGGRAGSAPSDGGAEDGGEAGAENGGGRGGVSTSGAAGMAGARGGAAAGGRAGGGSGGARGGGAGVGGRAHGGANGAGSAGGVGGRAGSGGAPAVHAFFFSEYVEGSSSYKALEIQAREASTFAGCRLVTYFNGSSSGAGIALDGALAKGAVTTLCSTPLATLVGEPCVRATNLTFNGDDAVALECDGATLDVVGQIGVDPGDAWTSAEASTLNQTLRRRCETSAGDPNGGDAFDLALAWSALPVDTFEGLGVAECPAE